MKGEWQTPENVALVNTVGDEGWTHVTQDGKELWFTNTYWGSPGFTGQSKLMVRGLSLSIIGQFACEPSVDGEGDIYFVYSTGLIPG